MTITSDPMRRGDPSAVALVPVRMGGKSRLSDALPRVRRDDLVLAMLDDVIAALRVAGIGDIRILAGDRDAAEAAAARGLAAIEDPETSPVPIRDAELGAANGDRALRTAVDAALAAVDDTTVRIVAAADLPRLLPSEVRRLVTHPADVAVAPTSGGGTALLRLSPGVTIPSRYGPGSAAAHLEEARRARLTSVVLDLPSARHDVDLVTDLTALKRTIDGKAPGTSTAAFLSPPRG